MSSGVALKPRSKRCDSPSRLDLPTVGSPQYARVQLSTLGSQMIAFEVQDMTLGQCVSTVTEAVLAVDPAAQVKIDLATHRVEIDRGADLRPTAPRSPMPASRRRRPAPEGRALLRPGSALQRLGRSVAPTTEPHERAAPQFEGCGEGPGLGDSADTSMPGCLSSSRCGQRRDYGQGDADGGVHRRRGQQHAHRQRRGRYHARPGRR